MPLCWRILALREILPKLVNLMSGRYSSTESVVMCDATITYYFPVNSEVCQGCVLAPTLFNICMHRVLGRKWVKSGWGVSLVTVRITDLDFADDV